MTGQPQHQLPLYGRLGVAIGSNSCLKGFVVFGILQRTDHRLGRESMADGIAAGTLFAFLGRRSAALGCIAAVAAPTGSGKTLAAFMTAIDDLIRQGLDGALPDETQVVCVSPLKALSNDIRKNH